MSTDTDKMSQSPLDQVQNWPGHWIAPGSALTEDETKALGDGPPAGMVRVRMVASAAGEDAVGDVMMPTALEDMVRDFKRGIVMVADHGQSMKEVMGKTVYGRIDGERVIATVDLDEQHEVTAMVLRHIELGIPTGPSIRFRIPQNGAKYLRDTNGLQIHRVQTHSLDPVAIPAVTQARGSMERLKSYMASQSPDVVPEEATMELTAENLKAIAEAVAPLLAPLQQELAGLRTDLDGLKTLPAQEPAVADATAAPETTPEDAFKALPEDEQKAVLEFRQKRDTGLTAKSAYEPPPVVETDPDAPFTLTPEERQKALDRLRGKEVMS